MSRSIAKTMMNKGNARERQLGRQLSRGRVRGLSADILKTIEIADRIIKDFGASPPADAMVGADVHNPTPPSRKKTRLLSPHEE